MEITFAAAGNERITVNDASRTGDASCTVEKLNNHLANKKQTNHMRHTSAPTQRVSQLNVKKRISERGSKGKKEKLNTAAKDDADKTFDSFVNYENYYRKGDDDDNTSANDSAQNKGTQTSEKQNNIDDREAYFRSRENKRIDSTVKKAQKAYYETYLKELQHETKVLVPHPPSQRPEIRKPVNTNRINR